jgi:DUF971 family protein
VGEEITPLRIELRPKARSLFIELSDGTSMELPHRAMRLQCRCAGCVYIRRSGRTISAPDDIEILAVVPYGANAVRLIFSDGHERGIFPFSYLRELERSPSSV